MRKLTWQASLDYVTDARGCAVQSRDATGLFRIDFQSSDQASLEYSREYELLPAPFVISPGVVVPAGGYTYQTTTAAIRSASSARCPAGCPRRPAPCTAARGRTLASAADGA